MATEKVQILIDAKNNASRELNQVSRDLTSLNQTGSRLAALSKGMGMIGAVVGSAATVGIIAKTSVELAKLAGAYSTLKNSFDGLAAGVGQSSDEMLQSLRTASNGMISDMALVQAANRAMLLGVADSGEEMAQLLQVAMVRGQAMGLSAEQAFNDIVTGIGRMSPLILDNLGIVTGGEKVFNDYAEAIGKAADELTDAEKKQALLNSVVASSADIVATATESATGGFERLKASIDNAKVSLGLLFADDFNIGASRVAETIDTLIAKFTEFNEMLRDDYNRMNFGDLDATQKNLDSVMRMIMDAKVIMDDLANQLIDAAIAEDGSQFDTIKMQIDGLSQSFESLGNQYNEIAIAMGQEVLNIGHLRNGVLFFEEFTEGTDEAVEALDNINEAAGTAQRILSDLVPLGGDVAGGLDLASVALDILARNAAAANTDIIELLRTMGTGQAAAINFAGAIATAYDTMAKVQDGPLGLSQASKDRIGNLPPEKEIKQINGELAATARGVSSVNSEFESLKSTINGIVSGAIGPVAGVDANDLLPRPDAVNENARRLADIAVNGFKGQDWLDEFKNEVPDVYQALVESGDPKTAAAQMLKDFQDGLINGTGVLIDKERAKDLVRRALLGQANTQSLINEIAQELAAETGTALSTVQAQAQSLLGGGGMGGNTGAGAAFGRGMIDEVGNSTLGADLGGVVMAQVTASVALIEASGKEAGRALVRGVTATFTDIPAAFIAAVASLVTPAVVAAMANNGGRTGAAAS